MKTRKTQPKNNKYFIRQVSGGYNGAVKGSPTISGADVLCNCVGYANGRFNEIGEYGKCKFQLVCNAENFIESAKKQGLTISSKPVQGGIMVWQKGATLSGGDGAGHVAVVEEVYSDGTILTSESGWASWAFKTVRRDNSNGRWGQGSAYKFRGCIINPAVSGEVVPTPKLDVDGIGGAATIRALQGFLGTPEDGLLSGQNKALKKYYPAITAVAYGSNGSTCVKALQKWVGTSTDGVWGEQTSKALQKKLGVTADGIFGVNSVKALQTFLNSQMDKKEEPKKEEKKEDPAPAKTDYLVIDVSEFQKTIDWAKVKAAGIKGAIIRCGFRGYEKGTLKQDSMFLNHIKGAHAAGLKVGIYFFTEGINASEGKEEAAYAINLWKKTGIPLSYPIAVDTEHINAKNVRANDLSKAKRTEVIKAFCEEVKRQGYEPMIYASTSWFNNKLDMSKLPYKIWCAQYYSKCEYKGDYILWQYTSEGKVNGISGVVDMNHCYIEGTETKVPETPVVTTVAAVAETTAKKTVDELAKEVIDGKWGTGDDRKKRLTAAGYDYDAVQKRVNELLASTGEMPTLALKKSNAEVKADAIRWLKWIAGDNTFHYGHGKEAHHNGCYFCGTEGKLKKGKGIVDYEHTYCCNPLIGAAWAHGGCVPKALELCRKCSSWDFGKGKGYDKSSLFDNLGHPAKSSLQAGDVLCSDTHVAMYIGGGKLIEASGGDDNVKGSKSWNNSIHVAELTDKKYKSFKRVHRYNSSVNTSCCIYHGEVSKRVEHLQAYLNWYGNYGLAVDGEFGDKTLAAVKDFQKKQGITVDGIVGPNTITVMGKVVK